MTLRRGVAAWFSRLLGPGEARLPAEPDAAIARPRSIDQVIARAPTSIEAPEERMVTGVFDVAEALYSAADGHGIAVVRDSDRIVVEDGALMLCGGLYDRTTQPGCVVLMLEIVATSPRLPFPIVERYAGFGDDASAAAKQAYFKFITATFHVLVEAFTTHACDDQIDRERWSRAGVAWTVYGGPTTGQHVGEPMLGTAYPAFYSALERLFAGTVAEGAHCVSVFFAVADGELGSVDITLDNAPWLEGEALVRAQPWPHARWETVRQFIVALPES